MIMNNSLKTITIFFCIFTVVPSYSNALSQGSTAIVEESIPVIQQNQMLLYSQQHRLSADENIIELIQQINESMISGYIENLTAFGPRVTGSQACNATGNYIYNQFTNMGLPVCYHNWSWGYSGSNIECTLLGNDPSSDEIYLLCAHYDSVAGSPGADDDASGIAVLLAAAYIMHEYTFNHTVRFVAFSGEEEGLLGSNIYVNEVYQNRENIAAVIAADMIGYTITESGGITVTIGYDPESEWIMNHIYNVSQTYPVDLEIYPILDTYPYQFMTDQYSFWRYDFNAVYCHEFDYEENPYQHTEDDTLEHVNLTYATKIAKLILASLATYADLDTATRFTAYAHGPYSAAVRENIHFYGSAISGTMPYNWSWNFSDGNKSYLKESNHSYFLPGNYTITLTVTDSHNNSASDITLVTVLATTPIYNIDKDRYYSTIQGAITDANPNNRIAVGRGIYNEHIQITTPVTLLGENSSSTTIDGGGRYNVVELFADEISLQNFTIRNGGELIDEAGIFIDSNNTLIANNVITNNNDGIFLPTVSNHNIFTNTIINNRIGVYLSSSINNIISGNTVSGNYKHGIIIHDSDNNSILGNKLYSNGDVGISLSSSNDNILFDNILNSNNNCDIYISGSLNNILSGNIIALSNIGINLYIGADGNTISNNNITSNSYGIYFRLSNSNIISDNMITSNGFGLYIYDHSNNNEISGNTINLSNYGIKLTASSNSNILYHNNFMNNVQQAYDQCTNKWYNSILMQGNHWDDFDTPGEGAYDDFQGISQEQPGSDGIIDQGLPNGGVNPYTNMGGGNQDLYPLMNQFILGDMNVDGTIDFGDINSFVFALSNPVSYQNTYHIIPSLHGDINQDGSLDFGDINPFVAILTG